MPMLRIGPVSFGMDGPAYDTFTHKMGVNWAAQGRIGRKPALQTTGKAAETITLTGTIYGLFNNLGIGQVKKLTDLMDKEEPQLVIDGTGRKYGYFVINENEEVRTAHIDNGAPQKQAFTLTLTAYGEDMLSPDATGADGSMDLGGGNGNIA